VYTCGTPYVFLNIILLSTPTIADVTKIAHRERVPNGTLPKLGRVLIPLWGKATLLPPKKRRLWWRCASLLHQLICHRLNMLLPEYVCLTDAIPQRIIGQARFISSFIAATTWFLEYRHILHWCRHMEQWSFTDAAKWNIYFIYVHLCHLHLQHLFPSTTTSTTVLL